MTIVFFTAILWMLPGAAAVEPAQNALAEAQRLREAGSFSAAVELLRTEVANRPDDGDAARLLAQTLYWLKDIAGAQAVYDTAMVRHPQDFTLRLQYARMLAETGQGGKARELLVPLIEIPGARAEADTLLGTLAYWGGDLTSARNFFVDALGVNPNQEEARNQLREILVSKAPWLRVSSTGWRDDQPFTRVGVGLETGWFATPLTELIAHFQPVRYELDGSSRTIDMAEAGLKRYIPAMRLDTELAAGAIRRPQAGRSWDWTGRAAVGIRLPAHLTVRARTERTAYLWTRSSLDSAVMVRSLTGLVRFDEVRGWLGETAYQQERYSDGNTIRTAYGWLLAPLVFRKNIEIQGGYAASATNADASRYVLLHPNQSYAPGDPAFDTAGHYAPYYTPSHLVTHSAIAALKLGPARNATFRIGGSHALRATDVAPFFYVSAGEVIRGAYSRKLSPWEIHSSVQIAMGNGFTIEPTATCGHSAFYSWATAGFQLTYHFSGAAHRASNAP